MKTGLHAIGLKKMSRVEKCQAYYRFRAPKTEKNTLTKGFIMKRKVVRHQ